jgi:hypothetical protein
VLPAILGALAIGISLGLLGSGGSILTVPALIYLGGQPEKVAIAGSLGVVGAISLAGALPYARQKLVDWPSVVWFGIPGMAGTYGGAWLARWVDGRVQMLLFGCVALVAAILLLRPRPPAEGRAPRARWKVVLDGLGVGVLTGLVGVGGGFLIVPALVLLGGLPMRRAVGTSLVIIALKSFTGFVKYVDVLDQLGLQLDWRVLGLFTAVGVAGSVAGNFASGRLPQAALQRAFAVLLIGVGAWVVAARL